MDKFGLDALEGRVFVAYAGPYVLLWTLVLGLRLLPPPSGSAPALSARLLGALLFTSTGLGLWLLQPPDLSLAFGVWWTLLFWLFGLAAPLGVLAFRYRESGRSLLSSVALLLLGLGLAAALGLAMASALTLPALTLELPLVVAGSVFAMGLGVLRPARFGLSHWRSLAVASALAVLVGSFVAVKVFHPTYETGYVTGIVDLDLDLRRALVRLERVSIPMETFVEIDLQTGVATELSRRTVDAGYAGNIRVELRRSSLAVALGRHDGQRFCHQAGRETVCAGHLPGSERYALTTHPRAALALATRWARTEVIDLVSGSTWSHSEAEGRIRWPCFADERRVLFRVDRGSFPYAQLAMDLVDGASGPVGLALGHELQCLAQSSVAPQVRFLRGRRRESRPSRIQGPGLPEPGLDLGFTVLVSSWSGDGEVLGLLYEKGWFHRFRLDEGFTEPMLLGPTGAPVLDYEGNRFAHVLDRGEEGMEVVVRALPAGEIVARQSVQVADVDWDQGGDLLLIQSWTLRRFDPLSGESTDLFPPPSLPIP
jgi:hypothetical protein